MMAYWQLHEAYTQEKTRNPNRVARVDFKIRDRRGGLYKNSLGTRLAGHPLFLLGHRTATTGLAATADFKVHPHHLLMAITTTTLVKENTPVHDTRQARDTSFTPKYRLV
jgi:hypothetical protein